MRHTRDQRSSSRGGPVKPDEFGNNIFRVTAFHQVQRDHRLGVFRSEFLFRSEFIVYHSTLPHRHLARRPPKTHHRNIIVLLASERVLFGGGDKSRPIARGSVGPAFNAVQAPPIGIPFPAYSWLP